MDRTALRSRALRRHAPSAHQLVHLEAAANGVMVPRCIAIKVSALLVQCPVPQTAKLTACVFQRCTVWSETLCCCRIVVEATYPENGQSSQPAHVV